MYLQHRYCLSRALPPTRSLAKLSARQWCFVERGGDQMRAINSESFAKKGGARSTLSRRRFLRQSVRISTGSLASGILGFIGVPYALRVRAQESLPSVDLWVSVGSTEFLFAVMKGRKLDEKHGFNGMVTVTDASAVNQALLTGRVKVGSSEPIPTAIANNAGKALTLFGPELWNHCSFVVPAASPGTSLKDFAGKRIALLPELSGTFTSTQVVAAKMGLNLEKDFNLVTGPPPAVIAFLERGDVSGIIMFEPFVGSLVSTGKYRVVFGLNQFWKELVGGDMLFAGVAADQSWLQANKDTGKRIAAALVEAGQVIRSDPTVFDQFGKVFGFKTPSALELAKQRLPAFFPTDWGTREIESGRRLIAEAVAMGIIKRPAREIIVAL
jgi:ABC-type nitrate/sulfonate/bicarbonate transport system substrate-binding protein